MINRKLRILLIDDNPGDRALVLRELKKEFPQLEVQEITEARSFDLAVEAGEFDVVITDYQLRWSNGLELLHAIKKLYSNCPVIMFTNTGNEEIAVEAMKSKLDDYVLKAPNRYIRVPVAVKAVLELSQAKLQAALLEIRLRSLLSQLEIGVFRTDSEGNLLEGNPALLKILGAENLLEAGEILEVDLQNIHSQSFNLSNSQPQKREIKLQPKDGEPVWVLLTTTFNTIDREKIVDGLIEDITAKKLAELKLQCLNQELEERVRERTAQLEAANQRLETTNQALEEFAYSVSHDLRAPLRAIQALTQGLLEEEGMQLSLAGQEYIQRIYASIKQAYELVQDLLTYSQVDRAELPVRKICLKAIVAEVIKQLEPELQERQARVNISEPLPTVIGNHRILVQVLINLFSNGIKFVQKNIQPQIQVWGETRGEWVRLWIQDNGIGIDPKNHQQIFQPFKRLHNTEKYSGTGIGLAIVRKGIERMGGQVGVESQSGKGSRFWLELPAARD